VFVEAAGLGKVVVAPSATWMAAQMATGGAVGTIFTAPTAESVVAALCRRSVIPGGSAHLLARSLPRSGKRIQVNDILNE
jgi:hypothetical protein